MVEEVGECWWDASIVFGSADDERVLSSDLRVEFLQILRRLRGICNRLVKGDFRIMLLY